MREVVDAASSIRASGERASSPPCSAGGGGGAVSPSCVEAAGGPIQCQSVVPAAAVTPAAAASPAAAAAPPAAATPPAAAAAVFPTTSFVHSEKPRYSQPHASAAASAMKCSPAGSSRSTPDEGSPRGSRAKEEEEAAGAAGVEAGAMATLRRSPPWAHMSERGVGPAVERGWEGRRVGEWRRSVGGEARVVV